MPPSPNFNDELPEWKPQATNYGLQDASRKMGCRNTRNNKTVPVIHSTIGGAAEAKFSPCSTVEGSMVDSQVQDRFQKYFQPKGKRKYIPINQSLDSAEQIHPEQSAQSVPQSPIPESIITRGLTEGD